jgi:hypothetical protein
MTDLELMQMALDGLNDSEASDARYEAIQALRERLYGKWEPQIEQLYTPKGDLISISIKRTPDGPREQIHPKREWVGLTRSEAEDVVDGFITIGGDVENWVGYWHAIEAKLKEKNS